MYRIEVSRSVLEVSRSLCDEIRQEWYALPLGKMVVRGGDRIFCIEDLYVPEQLSSGTHVEIPSDINVTVVGELDKLRLGGEALLLLGMWHSHGGFQVFHSKVDLANIETIFECFLSYIPSDYSSEELIGVFRSEDLNVNPIIENNRFVGMKVSFGASTIYIDFGGKVSSPTFFVKWFKHFYDMRCMFEILKDYYKFNPTIRNYLRAKSYYIVSVVVNNRGDMLGEVFVKEHTTTGITMRTERADIVVVEDRIEPYFLSRMSIEDIMGRIRRVIQTG